MMATVKTSEIQTVNHNLPPITMLLWVDCTPSLK